MSLRIYLDDCVYAHALVAVLRAAGHHVLTPPEAGTARQADEIHFQYARANDLVLLTRNGTDFALLHAATPQHPGILVVYLDNDPTRDMSDSEIVKAIANIEAAGVDLRNSFQPLNAWRY